MLTTRQGQDILYRESTTRQVLKSSLINQKRMNLKYRRLMLLSLFTILMLSSCSDDPEPVKPGAAGFFVVNEGGYGNGNTSISFYDRATDQMINDVFAARNGRPLGDQSQSMTM